MSVTDSGVYDGDQDSVASSGDIPCRGCSNLGEAPLQTKEWIVGGELNLYGDQRFNINDPLFSLRGSKVLAARNLNLDGVQLWNLSFDLHPHFGKSFSKLVIHGFLEAEHQIGVDLR